MLPYGDRWRARRRLCHEALNVRLARDIEPHQYKQTHRLLARLLDSPECFMHETELFVISHPSAFPAKGLRIYYLFPEAWLELLSCL